MDGAAGPLTDSRTVRVPASAEERRVALWRFAQSRNLGLTYVEARMFAESGSDLGLLRNLVARGCPPSLALRIAL